MSESGGKVDRFAGKAERPYKNGGGRQLNRRIGGSSGHSPGGGA